MAPRILQVITDTDRRGAQVFAVDLHAALARRGREVRTVALAPGISGGLDVPTLGRAAVHPATLAALRAEIRNASVVVGHGSTTLPTCALASLATRTPFVFRQISDSLFWADTWGRRLRVRAGLRCARSVVALWSGAASVLEQHFAVPRRKLVVIPNGVPAERFPPVDDARRRGARRALGLPPNATIVACIGALVPEKGVHLLVSAMRSIPDATLLIAGAGPERERLEAMAAREIPDRVRFVGSLADPNQGYAAADVFVLPSLGGDSMPATLIEAGFVGVPVVTTPVEGIPEIVASGETGDLVPINDVDALAQAIRRILAEQDRRERYINAARRRCLERFAIDPVAAAWDEALGPLIGRRDERPVATRLRGGVSRVDSR